MRAGRPLDIAIVGIGCRFPGAADLATYWENVLFGRDCTSDVPKDRWDPAIFHDPDSTASDRVASRRGGFLDSPIEFDPSRHGIMPLTVEGGEPEQFLVLDAAKAALDDAGLTDGIEDGRRVEVVIGRGNYFNRGNLTRLQHGRILAQTLTLLRDLHPEWSDADFEAIRADLKAKLPPFEPATIPGQVTNATAGRVANRFDISGASYVIDAASASSMVALDLGARALIERRADLALVGAVYIGCDVDFPMVFSQLGALSKTGKARPFAADADGTLPGEGVGVLVLKRLQDAERSMDRIYAVIKGVGLASDGKGQSLAAPSARGHARAIRRAYRRSQVDPATVGFVEGHGLGVPASDRAELQALARVFPPLRWGQRALGAVSAQIGHAMPAAGMAGLIKAALSLHHRVIPPAASSEAIHPLLTRNDSPFTLNPSARPWIQGDRSHPRRAGVNAFGFAGISGHAILEEHSPSADGPAPGSQPKWESEAILIAARDRAAWLDRARQLLDWLSRGDNRSVALKDLAFTLNASAENSGPFRVGLVVATTEVLRERLQTLVAKLADPACRSIRDARGVYFWEDALGGPGSLAFLFPGEGSQYPGMLADLCPHFPEVRKLFDTSDRIAIEQGRERLPSDILFGPTAQEDTELWEIGAAVNVVLSAQWGIHHLLRGLGLQPDAVVGHSSGEFLALASAGMLDVDTELENRLGSLGAIFEKLDSSGQVPSAVLAAIASDRERVEEACRQSGAVVTVAMDNCPHQVVIAGDSPDVDKVLSLLKEQGVMCEKLPFARAYHTAAFTQALEPIDKFFQELPLRAPTTHFYSCAVGRRVMGDVEEVRRLAVQQWASPVAFRSTIEAMYADGVRLFVDVGARGNLAGFVEDTLRGRPHFAIGSQLPRRSGLTQLNHLVASLFAHGISLTPEHLYRRRQPKRIDLDRDLPAVRSGPALAVGFPEMRLSSDLASALRERVAAPSARTPEEPPPQAPITESRPVEPAPSKHAPEPRPRDPKPVAAEHQAAKKVGANGHAPAGLPPARPPQRISARAAAMTNHLKTMDAFLETQRQVMGAFQTRQRPVPPPPTSPAPAPKPKTVTPPEPIKTSGPPVKVGPWVGTLVSFLPGHSLVAERMLDVQGDPVGESHTLGGRRVSAIDPTRKGLPVVPFTVMAEILAQAASPLLPDLKVVALRDVQANRWIRYELEPIKLEVRANRDPARPDEVRVQLFNRAASWGSRIGGETPVFEGRVIFAPRRSAGPPASDFHLEEARLCRFSGPDIYEEQWLFHGPALQAVTQIGSASPHGIEGTLRVLPRRGLLRPTETLAFHTDPIVLDAYTHLLGCWGLDQVPWGQGDVIFPLRVAELAIYENDPGEGGDVPCRIKIREASQHRVVVDAELVGTDGRIWVNIVGWEDWRFYWPSQFRDQFRQPSRVFVGDPLPLPEASSSIAETAQGVWLQPPVDMSKPVWRDVFEWVQLGPDERQALRAERLPDSQFTLRLWESIAAKEAVRRLWAAKNDRYVYPGDLSIHRDIQGRSVFQSLLDPDAPQVPAIAVAHADGVAIACASLNPQAQIGLAIEMLASSREDDARPDQSVPNPHELSLLQRSEADYEEWASRIHCAKQAALRALCPEHEGEVGRVVVTALDVATGMVDLTIHSESSAHSNMPLRIATARRGNYVWSWTIVA